MPSSMHNSDLTMTMTSDESQFYATFADLQRASDGLIGSLPDEEHPVSAEQRMEIANRIAQFIDRAVATGAMLDAPADRRAAQALIDFWVSKSYAIPRDTGPKQRTVYKASTTLKPFDPTTVTSAIEAGAKVFASFDERDRELAGRLLLRMVRIGDAGSNFLALPVKATELDELGSF